MSEKTNQERWQDLEAMLLQELKPSIGKRLKNWAKKGWRELKEDPFQYFADRPYIITLTGLAGFGALQLFGLDSGYAMTMEAWVLN